VDVSQCPDYDPAEYPTPASLGGIVSAEVGSGEAAV